MIFQRALAHRSLPSGVAVPLALLSVACSSTADVRRDHPDAIAVEAWSESAQSVAATSDAPPSVSEDEEEPSFWTQFLDEEDGALDMSNWLTSGTGFLPLAIPLTEPAVGLGVAGGALYFHRPDDPSGEEGASAIPPSISFAGGAATDNGTRAAFGGHLGVWNDGKTRYTGAVFAADVNLTLFGTSAAEVPDGVDWNIQAEGTFQQIKFAVAKHVFLGAQYLFVNTHSRLGDSNLPIEPIETDSKLAGLGPTVTYDSRNTIFTPTSGLYANATLLVHDEVFGGDFDYPKLQLDSFKYWDLNPFVLGLRVSGRGTGDGSPFYALPYLQMRGVPAFRYVGRHAAWAEVEPVWRVTPRWRLLGFLSAGQAVQDASDFGDAETIVAGGVGFRYTLARMQGLAMGLDLARGPEDTAVYFVIGSYWIGS